MLPILSLSEPARTKAVLLGNWVALVRHMERLPQVPGSSLTAPRDAWLVRP